MVTFAAYLKCLRHSLSCRLLLGVLPLLVQVLEASSEEQLAYELSTRYTPYTSGAAVLDLERLSQLESAAWWSTPELIRQKRAASGLPLAGLHLALDPGHIGGSWASWEGRHFRISAEDHWVREGELVLEVAQRVRTSLLELGAEVTLLRETCEAVNPKSPMDYWEVAVREVEAPKEWTLAAQFDYARAVRDRAVRLSIVIGELAERARLVNEVIQPDALISLHINAAPWPEGDALQLVNTEHSHVLIFGCLSAGELASPRQQEQLITKLCNGSGPVELTLGAALDRSLALATGLPASVYSGLNAIQVDPDAPGLWARNLMLLRLVECPVVLLEPYVANSHKTYARLQKALALRAAGAVPEEDDVLVEYAGAVVAGVLAVYGSEADGLGAPDEKDAAVAAE